MAVSTKKASEKGASQEDAATEKKTPPTKRKIKLVGAKTYTRVGLDQTFVRGPVYTLEAEVANSLLKARGSDDRLLFRSVKGGTVKGRDRKADEAQVGEVVDAIKQIDDSDENWTDDGKPATEVLAAMIGKEVHPSTRDAAWQIAEAEMEEAEEDEENQV